MNKLKANNKALLKIWDGLSEIFLNYTKYSFTVEQKLQKLGVETVHDKGNHVKLFFRYNGKRHCITIATSPSDRYAGRQILRQIRKIYL